VTEATHNYISARAKRLATAGELPPNAIVDGWLDLSGTQITALPEGLTVHGGLDLRGTQITALPEGLTVHGSLDLSGTQITALPEGLTVHGWLDLRGTQITALPEGLTVHGWLDLRGAEHLQFPTPYWNTAEATRFRALAADDSYALLQTDTGLLSAGCRGPWTVNEAVAHWGKPSRTDARAKMFVAAINALEAVPA